MADNGHRPADADLLARDGAARARAVDPRFNVVLEASAGTGKTRVLVERFVNLLRSGVDPANVLAITFTRKAASEMRDRVVQALRLSAERGELPPARWRRLRDRLGDIAVSTIDAFCLSLLREFPLEAGLDPGFSLADETEVPRLVDEALDRALRTCRALAREDERVALVFAQLGDRRARRGLAVLLGRRLVAPDALARFLARSSSELTVSQAVDRGARALLDVFDGVRGGLDGFIATGPVHPSFHVLTGSLRQLRSAVAEGHVEPGTLQATFSRARDYFLTRDGSPRQRTLRHGKAQFPNDEAWRLHRGLVLGHAGDILRAWRAFRHDLNLLVARGTWRMYRVAESEYRRTLDAHAVLDFPDVLLKAVELLRQMEEFAQSRFRLESRYHHVLVDEFQDTSRAQWELVALLVQAWGAGVGAAFEGPLPPSIFLVGDRKQSIYGFRDADVGLLQEASRYLGGLRPDGDVRRSISRSFRSLPHVLAFVNDVCRDIGKAPARADAFRYDEQDVFPIEMVDTPDGAGIGVVSGPSPDACASMVADEITGLLASGAVVRDRDTGVRRALTPADIAILFRTRGSHRAFEAALEQRGVSAYVYKGLGFFDAPEIRDVRALLWHLADPASDLRAAAILRSGFVRISDEGLRRLAPGVAQALESEFCTDPPLDADDRLALDTARQALGRWRALVDVLPPAELLDRVLHESAYAVEIGGPGFQQARENLRKLRGLLRRLQNRGYATLARAAAHLDHLATGDDANAAIDARDAVSLMTVHASKGLEFPVAFIVDLGRGTSAHRDPIRVYASPSGEEVSVSVGDYSTDSDEDALEREREETKRLLYVALTRARDRLYLSVHRDADGLRVARGSLAEVLPAALLAALGSAAPGVTVAWTASSGESHSLRGVSEASVPGERSTRQPQVVAAGAVDRLPLDAGLEGSDTSAVEQALPSGAGVDRLVGSVVHRLLERHGFDAELPEADRDRLVLATLRREELHELEDLPRFIARASRAYQELLRQDEVRRTVAGGQCFHEVPFALAEGHAVVHGVIDCLVRTASGRLVVFEFKTGAPRREHEIQTARYLRAAAALFPGADVSAHVIYSAESPTA